MSDIRMADGSINFNGEWLTAEDIKGKIKEKMDSGDMRFADMAAALQELNEALENAHTLEVKIVLTKAEHDKLRAMGGEDDSASVRKAIRAFVGSVTPKAEAKATAAAKPTAGKPAPTEETIPCTKCKTPIPIPTSERPIELECEFCGTSVLLPAETAPAGEAAPPDEAAPTDGAAPPAETAPPAGSEAEPAAQEDTSGPKRTDHFIG